MLFSEEKFECYAMQAEAMSQAESKWYVDVDVVGAALGFTSHESRFLADHLENAGWATLLRDGSGGPVRMKLTLKGFRHISRLRRPRWQQWFDKHIGLLGVVGGVVLSAAFGLLSEAIKHWLFSALPAP